LSERHHKIGLLDIDGHNFPNLVLMKLSSYHKGRGDSVEFVNYFEKYDIVYKSKVFTFTERDKYPVQANKIVRGGTGYKDYTTKLPKNIEHIYPDYGLYNCDKAYGFLTRGCPNKCPWCVVPEKEGDIRKNADITEFWDGQKEAVLLDNNVLASDWGLKQIEKIVDLGIKIDFNQGLDARVIANNEEIANLLGRVKWSKPLRMACDTKSQMPYIEKAVKLLRKYNATPRNYFVYVLTKDIQDALERVRFLKNLGVDPFAQPYRDFENNVEPTKEQRDFARWVNHKAIFNYVEWENYR